MKYEVEHLFMDRIKTCAYSLILTVLIFFIGEKILLTRDYFMPSCMKYPKELHTNKKKLYKVNYKLKILTI